MIETLASINAPHFLAGIVLWEDKVVQTADSEALQAIEPGANVVAFPVAQIALSHG